ncbi:hypothetical protein ACOSZA_13070 [Mammaliicoccus sciuri]|uniref:hypothetical protein n=1 Tax=Mammaliicoccus sciuri TaxID=1296 RepID=UPI003BA25D8B
MLTEKSENFLIKLRVELLFRGKNEEETNEIIDELRDHLYTSEQNNEDVSNITDTPIKSYADNFSSQMQLSKGLFKNIIYLVIYMLGIIMIPRFFNYSFSITVGLLIYLIFVILIGWVLQLYFWKKIVLKWGDSKKTYALVAASAVGVFLIMILGEFLINHFPIYELIKLNKLQGIITGIILLIIFVTGCFILKHKIFAYFLILLSLPDLIAIILSSNNYDQYIIISTVILIAFSWLLAAFAIYRAFKSTKET